MLRRFYSTIAYALENNLSEVDLSDLHIVAEDFHPTRDFVKLLKDNPTINAINLSGNPIRSIEFLCELTHLKAIDLSDSDLQSLEGIDKLVDLKKLDIRDTPLRSAEELKNLQKIEELYLCNNKLEDLSFISNFSELRVCYAVNCRLMDCSIFKDLVKLEKLNLNSNRIQSLISLNNLNRLQHLSVSNNQIGALDGIENLYSLQELIANNNLLSSLSQLYGLPLIELLDASNNKINSLKGIERMKKLKVLSLGNNKIDGIDQVSRLIKLESLDVSSNNIKNLNALSQQKKLKVLDVSINELRSLKGVEGLKSLYILRTSRNKLINLNPISSCSKLRYLFAGNNQIESLSGISLNSVLCNIDLRANRVGNNNLLYLFKSRSSHLEIILDDMDLPDNNFIALADNAISYVPEAILIQKNEGILNYLTAQEDAAIINLEVKCILFGNGEVGKTTLSKYLQTHEFIHHNSRTHGILIDQWHVFPKEYPRILREKIERASIINRGDIQKGLKIPNTLTVRLWDFGGQEYYHATHRIFMSNEVIYLLVWDWTTNTNDDEKGEYDYHYWIKNIQHFSENGVIINVQNKVKQQCQATDDDVYFKIAFRKHDNRKTIALFEDDISKLKSGLLNAIAKLPYIGSAFPKAYEDIKIALRNHPKPFITYQEYETICLEFTGDSSSVMNEPQQRETLVKFLDTTGSIVCFRFRNQLFSDELKNYVFTDPQWLAEVIYELLERGKPEFKINHVKRIAGSYNLPEDALVAIMKQFELIFEIVRNDEIFYVAPQYLPADLDEKGREALKWALAGKNVKQSFTLHYKNFLPKSNFLRFISKFGANNINYLFWKNGLVFIEEKTVFAQCVDIGTEHVIRIYIEDADVHLAKRMFDTFIAIDDTSDLLVSTDDVNYVNAKVLQTKILTGKKEIDTESGVTLNVSSFNFSFNSTTTKYPMKKQVKLFISYSNKDRDLRKVLESGLEEHLSTKSTHEYNLWSDQAIDIGADWRANIEEALQNSDGAILLISASFAKSSFIRQYELAEFLNRKKKEGYLIFPVLVRRYDFHDFQAISSLNFFKTFRDEYGLGDFHQRNEIMPFDEVVEGPGKSHKNLNEYFFNLSGFIHKAIKNSFGTHASES